MEPHQLMIFQKKTGSENLNLCYIKNKKQNFIMKDNKLALIN